MCLSAQTLACPGHVAMVYTHVLLANQTGGLHTLQSRGISLGGCAASTRMFSSQTESSAAVSWGLAVAASLLVCVTLALLWATPTMFTS